MKTALISTETAESPSRAVDSCGLQARGEAGQTDRTPEEKTADPAAQSADSAALPEQASRESANSERMRRLLERLDQQEQRLNGLLALRKDARLMQAHLWRFAPEERRPEILLPETESSAVRRILLDPGISVRENMRRMFQNSARAARGLKALRERRRALSETENGRARKSAGADLESEAAPLSRPGNKKGSPPPATGRQDKEREQKAAPRDVASFLSSDGYTLLRGKNARGNRLTLALARPQDLWLHARDGPSAHLIIRRAHAADEVP
ncbi:MAG: hypothetical protein LBJ82_04995, partial [Deltaproteobacteria bacterium]|nr:hypothetical protein [Deltaproteobacteria bacterium]